MVRPESDLSGAAKTAGYVLLGVVSPLVAVTLGLAAGVNFHDHNYLTAGLEALGTGAAGVGTGVGWRGVRREWRLGQR